jgi:hypothetical protein
MFTYVLLVKPYGKLKNSVKKKKEKRKKEKGKRKKKKENKIEIIN